MFCGSRVVNLGVFAICSMWFHGAPEYWPVMIMLAVLFTCSSIKVTSDHRLRERFNAELNSAVLLFVLVWKHGWRRLAGGPWGLDKDVRWFSAAWSIWCRFHISRLPWCFIIGVLLGFLRVRDSSARHWAFCSVNAGSGHFTNSLVGASLYTYLQSPVVSQWIISVRLVALTLFSPVLDADPLCYAATPKSFLITGG